MAKVSRFWHQFNVPFMLFTNLESILKADGGKYREKMNKIKADGNGKVPIPYAEKMNTHVLSEWCVHSTFACGYVPDPLKIYHGIKTV